MKKELTRIITAVVLVGIATGAYLLFSWKAPDKQDHGLQVRDVADKPAPTEEVETVAIQEGTIPQKLLAYGAVIPAPGARRIVSVPFESQVLSIFVNDGQKVPRGEVLLEIQPSPSTTLQFVLASNAFKLEQENLRQVERRVNQKLATNEQLLQAQQKLEEAQTKLNSSKKQGIEGKSKISAQAGGLIKKVNVQEGNIVPAGNPLIEIIAEDLLEAILGVEPEDINRVRPGQQVLLTHVNASKIPAVIGKVQRLSYEVNSSTRLVDVFLTIPSPVSFLLGETISGQIEVGSARGLIVPRSAVLSEDGRSFVFIVRNVIANKHQVRIGLESADAYVVAGEGISAGDQGGHAGKLRIERRYASKK